MKTFHKECPSPNDFVGEFYQHGKEKKNNNANSSQILPKSERGKNNFLTNSMKPVLPGCQNQMDIPRKL